VNQFFSPDTQVLLDDLLLLPQDGASTGPTGRPPNSYAVIQEGRSILFDAPYSWVVPSLRRLRDEGYPPAALVLSHSNVAGQGDAFAEIVAEFRIPVMLHPEDAENQESRRAGVEFEDPLESEVLEEADVEALHFRGHTEGSIVLYRERNGGVMLAGDSAVGPGPRQDQDPPRLLLPPATSDENAEKLREAWRTFGRPLRSVCPLHGTAYADRDDLPEITRPLIEGESM
jgi:glyoxylase-like metal-dependent hydrolase (beta-lactamase superfamily II)